MVGGGRLVVRSECEREGAGPVMSVHPQPTQPDPTHKAIFYRQIPLFSAPSTFVKETLCKTRFRAVV